MKDTYTITTESGIVIGIEKSISDNKAEVVLRIEEHRNCLLHWGLRSSYSAPWQIPEATWPEGSSAFDHSALRTPFMRLNGSGEITIRIDLPSGYKMLEFVLFFPEDSRWDNNRGRNYRIEISPKGEEAGHEQSMGKPELDRLAHAIIENETGRNSWTLMHRFNLCYDLLDEIKSDNLDGMALIFVWLRFSAIRQLDWQRNYNTKPRELGHAMDRLTLKLTGRYSKEQDQREMIRLIMTTLGRGGNAQRVRDEVLNIMHRHHIKEVSGRFMEEWHQKLHNNTTPDDIVICEAYLEFLRSDGDLGRFYKRLEGSGVTRERLESYERPIKSHPDFIPELKEALIRDFENFLGILKEVHSGTDLGVSIQASRYLLDEEIQSLMDFIWSHQNDPSITLLAEKITESRSLLTSRLKGEPSKVRDLLFLDIALEDFLRVIVERNLSSRTSGDELVRLVAMILENLRLSSSDEEFQRCLEHWSRLKNMPGFGGREWALHGEAVLDRIRQAMGSFIDRYYGLLQPKAEFLGRAFHADSWTVDLFSEEVLRGRSTFVLSMISSYLDPILRKDAGMGNWQMISRGNGKGEVKAADTLKSVQGKSFERPVVLVVDRIAGDEEIPQGVAAVVTPAIIDSLSHLAIRARNAGIFFAICYDTETVGRLKSLEGHVISLIVKKDNDIGFEESHEEIGALPRRTAGVHISVSRPSFTAYVLPMDDFDELSVGYKSMKLRNIQGKLPDWIGLPPSVAVPFGVFEKILAGKQNAETANKHTELLRLLEGRSGKGMTEVLAEIRSTVLTLEAQDELVNSLRKVMERAGLAWPDWNEAWMCIKRVWSSKWNERAHLSREANGIPHDALTMSVLIQKVIEADYSYVIHTVNPLTGAKDEVYSEVVLGLGEALAANYPGRGLSFTCKKGGKEPYLLSFPSKSVALYGGGLIFRSDSNGEDLAGYAGAGLYDSFVLPLPRKVSLDYTRDSLVWDENFRRDLLAGISNIGTIVEDVMKSAQDIEGAYSKGRYFVMQTRPQAGTGND